MILSVKSNIQQTKLILGTKGNSFSRFDLMTFDFHPHVVPNEILSTSDFDVSDDLSTLIAKDKKHRNLVKIFKLSKTEKKEETTGKFKMEKESKDFSKYLFYKAVDIRKFDEKNPSKSFLSFKKNEVVSMKLLEGEDRLLVNDLNFRLLLWEEGKIRQLYILGSKYDIQPQLKSMIWGENRSSFISFFNEGSIVSCELTANEENGLVECQKKKVYSLKKTLTRGSISSNGEFIFVAGRTNDPSKIFLAKDLEIECGDLLEKYIKYANEKHNCGIKEEDNPTLESIKSKIAETQQEDLVHRFKQSNLYYQNLEAKYMKLENDKKEQEMHGNHGYVKEITRLRKQLAQTVKVARMSAVVNRNYEIMTQEFSRLCGGHYSHHIRSQIMKRNHLFNMTRDIDKKTKKLLKISSLELTEKEKEKYIFTISDCAGFADLRERFEQLGFEVSESEDEENDEEWDSDEDDSDEEEEENDENEKETQNEVEEDEETLDNIF